MKYFKSDLYLQDAMFVLGTLHAKGFKNSYLTRELYSMTSGDAATEFIGLDYNSENDSTTTNTKVTRRISTYRGNAECDFVLGNFISHKYDMVCDIHMYTFPKANTIDILQGLTIPQESLKEQNLFPVGLYCQHKLEDFIPGVYDVKIYNKSTTFMDSYDMIYSNYFLEVTNNNELCLYEDDSWKK